MDPPPPPSAAGKLRLLCSYGGRIIPRHHSTALTYAGGDSKLLCLPLHSLSLSSLTHHLLRILPDSTREFVIKYQLPGEDLDSLVSVTSDEDVYSMIEEHSATSRIRLFIFPSEPKSLGSGLLDPKSETWFCDALKGVNLIRRGVSADPGVDNPGVGGDVVGVKSGLGPESVVLETSSSFGSTGSTVSMTNLPTSGPHGGDENLGFEKRHKLPSSASIESDNATPSAVSHQFTTTYQDSSVQLTSAEATAQPALVESASIFHNPGPGFQVLKTVQAGPHQASNPIQHQQEFQYVQAGSHYIPQYSATPSYYPMYYPTLSQHTPTPYQQNHPYPVYYLPVRPTQSYNTPSQYNLIDTSVAAPSSALAPATAPAPLHPQMQPLASKEVVSASTTPLIQIPSNQNQQQLVDLSDIDSTTQHVVNSEFDDDYAYTQIYKTQPSGPTLISQYQTMMTGADNIK